MTDYTSAEFWKGAPEGATHGREIFGHTPDFYRIHMGNLQYWCEDTEMWRPCGWRSINDDDMIPRPAPQWNGEGLPPVGVVCEAGIPHVSGPNNETRSIIWIEGAVIAYHVINGKTYAWFAEGDGFYPPGVFEFRPIKTPAQIAAEEREAAIDELTAGFSNDTLRSWAIRAYDDLGYRKGEDQ